jgi:undecaprenyl-diphosphatase
MLYSGHMNLFEAVILGVVQGVTEFLPISSTGHLVLVRDWLAVAAVDTLAFDAVLHFATTLAVVIYFRKDLMVLVGALFRKLGRLPVNSKDITLLYALLVGTIFGITVFLIRRVASVYESTAGRDRGEERFVDRLLSSTGVAARFFSLWGDDRRWYAAGVESI